MTMVSRYLMLLALRIDRRTSPDGTRHSFSVHSAYRPRWRSAA
jgi:hypothetical protein